MYDVKMDTDLTSFELMRLVDIMMGWSVLPIWFRLWLDGIYGNIEVTITSFRP